jgi:transcriptional regulator with XRE-family HTH domain
MSQPIDRHILRRLRDQHRLSQTELATKAGISKDSLSRIERGLQLGTRRLTQEKLAKALRVTPEQLTGETSADKDTGLLPPRYALGFRIDGSIDNAFELVAERYRLPVERIVELAPFLFVLAAERSLERRLQRLATLKDTLDQADAMAEFILHLPRTIALDNDTRDAISAEEASIAHRDILAADLVFRWGEEAHRFNTAGENPFIRSLQEDASEPAVAKIMYLDDDGVLIRVCRAEAMRLADNDEALATGILDGWVTLREIPSALRNESANQERLTWLREQVAKSKKEAELAQTAGSNTSISNGSTETCSRQN